MNETNLENNISEKVKQNFVSAWLEGHGGTANNVHLLYGDDGLVLLIPEALYQAEMNLSRNSENGAELLDQYLHSLLSTVASELIPMLEKNTDRTIAEVIPLVDLRAGWAIAFYRFKPSIHS
jgi:hypothetical protein